MATRSKARVRGLAFWLGIALAIVVVDQLTKYWIASTFGLHDVRTITPYFDIVRAHNSGAAFSFLAQAAGWQRWFFTGIGSIAAIFIVWMLKRHGAQRLFCWALTLILGGAVGNVIDRIVHGHVIDFIQVHYGRAYFPAFNAADSAITLGAVLLIVDELLRVRRAR
jgi:signal peptidase II